MGKKEYYYNKKDKECLLWIAKVLDFGVSLLVVSACNELRNAIVGLQARKDLYRNTVKQNANEALKASRIRERWILDNMVNKQFWEDYSGAVIDLANTDITRFKLAIKQTLDDARYMESNIISQIETARVLMDMSVKQWESVVEDAKNRYGRDFSKEFSEYNIKSVFLLWEKVCIILYKSGTSIDFNNPRVEGMFQEMCNKFAEGKYIDECLEAAKVNNPEFHNAIVIKEE